MSRYLTLVVVHYLVRPAHSHSYVFTVVLSAADGGGGMSVQCLLTTDCVTPDAGYATALLTTRLRQLCLTGNNKRAIHSAGVTIPYIKCDGILHLNFEIGGDF